MAQWSHAERTIFAKVVYYGPAFGGKTTNLESLHRITDPDGSHKLLSINTSDDRTLFFDLLPLDLGNILGYKVALKLYTVPGQVRYEATRQIVLSGADAVVFVADSTRSREEQNRWSLENLRLNMRSKGLDPERVPLLFQFNKQDRADAAPAAEVAGWLGLDPASGQAAVATEGRGVLETFMTASRTLLRSLVDRADPGTRRRIDVDALDRHLDAAFAPFLARLEGPQAPKEEGDSPAAIATVTATTEDLLQSSVRTSLELGERLSGQTARVRRLEGESSGFRRLSDALQVTGASFDRRAVLRATVATVADVLEAPEVSILRRRGAGYRREFGRRQGEDPLLTVRSGVQLLTRLRGSRGPHVIDDLQVEFGGEESTPELAGLRAAAVLPLEGSPERLLVAYASAPDGGFRPEDLQFLDTVAGHLAVGLEKVRLHHEISGQRDQLGRRVQRRTRDLRRALDELRSMERIKDRVLSNLSHEMRSPLTSALSAAIVLRDYDPEPRERREMADAVVQSTRTLERLVDDLLRVARMDPQEEPLKPETGSVLRLLDEAVELAGRGEIETRVERPLPPLRLDFDRMARALANLIDNAVKFSPEGSDVELIARPCGQSEEGGRSADLELIVRDRGPGVDPSDRERIFAPFEQGGTLLTDKPRGTGLGLYESRAVVRRHDGELECRPREGGGTEFVLRLPVDGPDPVHDPDAEEAPVV